MAFYLSAAVLVAVVGAVVGFVRRARSLNDRLPPSVLNRIRAEVPAMTGHQLFVSMPDEPLFTIAPPEDAQLSCRLRHYGAYGWRVLIERGKGASVSCGGFDSRAQAIAWAEDERRLLERLASRTKES